jgi:hypothetical protein
LANAAKPACLTKNTLWPRLIDGHGLGNSLLVHPRKKRVFDQPAVRRLDQNTIGCRYGSVTMSFAQGSPCQLSALFAAVVTGI